MVVDVKTYDFLQLVTEKTAYAFATAAGRVSGLSRLAYMSHLSQPEFLLNVCMCGVTYLYNLD